MPEAQRPLPNTIGIRLAIDPMIATPNCGRYRLSNRIADVQHASLTSFINGERSAKELWREVKAEVNVCLAACAKGGAGSVIITAGPLTNVSRKQVTVLVTALADSTLPMNAAGYVADALIMSDDFVWTDQGISDALYRLSDESTSLTSSDLRWASNRLATVP